MELYVNKNNIKMLCLYYYYGNYNFRSSKG